LVTVEVVGRAGYPAPAHGVILPGISSTDIRGRIARSEPVDHLLPAPVWRYIEQHGLYRPTPGGEAP
jgi:nicotinate-nucleotide adenylyltransferase